MLSFVGEKICTWKKRKAIFAEETVEPKQYILTQLLAGRGSFNAHHLEEQTMADTSGLGLIGPGGMHGSFMDQRKEYNGCG